MSLTLGSSISTAISVLNDETGVAYAAADLLGYANDALDTIASLAPHYFYERGTVECVENESSQTVSFTDAHSLVSVDRVTGGAVVHPGDRSALDRFDPSWRTGTPGPAVNWMPHADSPVRFYVSPPAPAGQILEVTYIRLPGEYTALQETGLPSTLGPAVADYIVGMAMSRDDEHINSARAQAFMGSFAARVKGS